MHVIDIVLPTVFLVAEFLEALSVRQFVCAAIFVMGLSGSVSQNFWPGNLFRPWFARL